MARIGHSSTRAAMIHQHAARHRDHANAAALDALIEEASGKISAGSGTVAGTWPPGSGRYEKSPGGEFFPHQGFPPEWSRGDSNP